MLVKCAPNIADMIKIIKEQTNVTIIHFGTDRICLTYLFILTSLMAEDVRFELTQTSLLLAVFETAPFDRLGSPPSYAYSIIFDNAITDKC